MNAANCSDEEEEEVCKENIEQLAFDAPQFFDFSKAKYQRYLKTLEKVLFPHSNSMSPLNPNTPLAVVGNSVSSDEREDDLWFHREHIEHEGFSPRSPPHPLITPSPHPRPKRALGSPRRISSSSNPNSQTPQSKGKSVIDDSIRFSNPKYLCSPPRHSPVVKSPLNHSPTLMLTDLLDKTPIIRKKPVPIASFLDLEASPTPIKPKETREDTKQTKDTEEEVDEVYFDATPIGSPTKENIAKGKQVNILSYSPSPPVLATKLISSSHTPTSPLDPKRGGVFASKAQRVLLGVNLDNRKRRSSRGLEDFFESKPSASLASNTSNVTNRGNESTQGSNVSTPSKGNELKRFKVGAMDFCPPPSRQPPPIFSLNEGKRAKNISTDDLKRLLNEHNQRIRPRLNYNNGNSSINNGGNKNSNKRTML